MRDRLSLGQEASSAKVHQNRVASDQSDYRCHSTGLRRVPIPSIVASIASPDFRNVRVLAPTPCGVPVEMMSPGSSVTKLEMNATTAATGNTISAVLALCFTSPLTFNVI